LELVYLWVEDYKNIHEQGFNFSPKFNCHYDGKTLTIKDNIDEDGNKQYIENFFGDNINVTAIVGKNGSGKSSVLECLNLIYLKKMNFNFILLYEESKENSNERYYISNIKISGKNLTKVNHIDIFMYIYSNDLIRIFDNSITVKQDKIFKYILHNSLQKKIKLTTFMYLPNRIKYKSIDLNEKFHDILMDYEDYCYDGNYDTSIDDVDTFPKKDIYSNITKIEDSYHQYLIILYFTKQKFQNNDILENISDLIEEFQKVGIKYLEREDFAKFLNLDSFEKNINDLSKKEKELYLYFYDFFEFDLIDNKGRSYNSLSHGERIIFGQFINFYYLSIKYKKPYLFLLDEAELSLHPNWQKKYLDELIVFLSDIERNFHIILTSHSPFLLSDIPKENIIFLDTYKKDEKDNQKEGNCKVVFGTKQTFGANIHTLLSDSFFMKGGLMGEFAKQKINEIIKNLKDKEYTYTEKEKTKVLLTIESIGEPFLKSKLLDMYNRRFIDDYKIREQKRIDEQIRILKEKREQL